MVYPLCLCGTGCMMLAHKSVLTQAVKANYVEKRLCNYQLSPLCVQAVKT